MSFENKPEKDYTDKEETETGFSVSGDDFIKDHKTPEKILENIKELLATDERNIAINIINFDCSKTNEFRGKVKIAGDFNNQNVENKKVLKNIEAESSHQNLFLLSVVISALNDSKIEVIQAESQNLQKNFAEKNSAFDEDSWELDDAVISSLHLTLYDSFENTEYGQTHVKKLKFKDDELPDLILLNEFWKIKITLRDSFLEWILLLGKHRSIDIRIKAADVLGKIICFDKSSFDLIVRRVLSVWAADPNFSIRRLIGRTLSFGIGGAEEEILDSQILGLIHFWITQNNFRLRQSATLISFSDIGLTYPDEIMENFNKVTGNEDYSLFLPITDTISALFELGTTKPEMHKIVLNLLDNWSREKKRTMRYEISQIILVMLMQQKILDVNNMSRIKLLHLLKKDKEYFGNVISSIFRNSLFGENKLPDFVFDEMRIWLENISDENEYKWMRYLCYLIVKDGNESEAKRFISYLKWWNSSYKTLNAGKIIYEIQPHLKEEFQKA